MDDEDIACRLQEGCSFIMRSRAEWNCENFARNNTCLRILDEMLELTMIKIGKVVKEFFLVKKNLLVNVGGVLNHNDDIF